MLDNPVWHALRGPQARFAQWSSDGTAVRFDPEVSVFAAVESFAEDGAWDGIREHGRDARCVLVTTGSPSPPADATVVFQEPLVQMVAADAVPTVPLPDGLVVTSLAAEDHDELAALVDLPRPGPWRPRTPELGEYWGVRDGGALVAVCGQRLRPPGAIEISAVATHPDHVRRGLAAALTTAMAATIAEDGSVPFLHVMRTNEPARALYRKLGFVERRELTIFAVRFED